MRNEFSYLKNHIGQWVQIDRGGPESQVGQLLAVKDDYLVVCGKDGKLFYYQASHIKSVTQSSTDEFKGEKNWSNVDPVSGETFEDLLENLCYSWIHINRGGPEKVEGVLTKVSDNYLILINGSELIHISTYHIKSISALVESKKEEEQENEKNKVPIGVKEDKKKKSDKNKSHNFTHSKCWNRIENLKIYTLSSPPSLHRSRCK